MRRASPLCVSACGADTLPSHESGHMTEDRMAVCVYDGTRHCSSAGPCESARNHGHTSRRHAARGERAYRWSIGGADRSMLQDGMYRSSICGALREWIAEPSSSRICRTGTLRLASGYLRCPSPGPCQRCWGASCSIRLPVWLRVCVACRVGCVA